MIARRGSVCIAALSFDRVWFIFRQHEYQLIDIMQHHCLFFSILLTKRKNKTAKVLVSSKVPNKKSTYRGTCIDMVILSYWYQTIGEISGKALQQQIIVSNRTSNKTECNLLYCYFWYQTQILQRGDRYCTKINSHRCTVKAIPLRDKNTQK